MTSSNKEIRKGDDLESANLRIRELTLENQRLKDKERDYENRIEDLQNGGPTCIKQLRVIEELLKDNEKLQIRIDSFIRISEQLREERTRAWEERDTHATNLQAANTNIIKLHNEMAVMGDLFSQVVAASTSAQRTMNEQVALINTQILALNTQNLRLQRFQRELTWERECRLFYESIIIQNQETIEAYTARDHANDMTLRARKWKIGDQERTIRKLERDLDHEQTARCALEIFINFQDIIIREYVARTQRLGQRLGVTQEGRTLDRTPPLRGNAASRCSRSITATDDSIR
jgi:uridine kinase